MKGEMGTRKTEGRECCAHPSAPLNRKPYPQVRGKRQEARGKRQEARGETGPPPCRRFGFPAARAASLPCPATRACLASPPCRPCVPTAPPPLYRSPPLCPSHPPRHRPIPPAPFPARKGGAHGCLTVCLPGYSDGFGRMDHAMNPKNLSRNPSQNPSPFPLPRRHRRSLQRAKRVTGLGGRSHLAKPSRHSLFLVKKILVKNGVVP